MPRNSTLLSNDTAAARPLTQGTTVTAVQASGATSHRQPRQCHGEGPPKTVKGAQSDPNYVSRLLLDCVAHVCRGGGNYSYATAVEATERQATNCYFALSRVLRVHSDYLATGHTVADNFTECRTICDFLLLRESAVNLQ